MIVLALRPFVATGPTQSPHGRVLDHGGIAWNPLLPAGAAIAIVLCTVTVARTRRIGWDQALLIAAIGYWILFAELPKDPCNYENHPALRRLAICG